MAKAKRQERRQAIRWTLGEIERHRARGEQVPPEVEAMLDDAERQIADILRPALQEYHAFKRALERHAEEYAAEALTPSEQMEALLAHLDSGARLIDHHGGGRPTSYDKPSIREAVLRRHEAFPRQSYDDVTDFVARQQTRREGDTLRDVRRAVRRYCSKLRWPDTPESQ